MREVVACALAILLLAGCFGEETGRASEGGARVILPDGLEVSAEVASTPAELARGLMWREELCQTCGMLFVFRSEGKHAFWMKNTKIPLDIIYLDGEFVVVDTWEEAQPCESEVCRSYSPKENAKYVLEINGGEAKLHGVEAGSKLTLFLDAD